MNVYLKFCFIFWLISGTNGQIANCFYRYQYFWIQSYEVTNIPFYTCNLDTEQSNFDEKLTRIDGQHVSGHSDADVKNIINYKDDKLKTISSIFCKKFPNLEIIQIFDAELESIDQNSLLNCKNLDYLILYGNKIREIPENLPNKNLKLTSFFINNNQLTSLPENLFLNQKKLKQLGLHENQINFLPSNIFHPLVNLEILYLGENKIESVNPEWFLNLKNLKWLGLDENQISEIPSKCFASLGNLEIVWLYENRIKILNSDSFDGLQKLRILNMYTNEISDLPVGIFTNLKNLQELSLANNKLATIHSDSFGIHNQLTTIYLGNNKINAIDPKFIDNSAVTLLHMENNICTQSVFKGKSEVMDNLKKCFANYQPRPAQFPSSCGRSIMPQGNIIGGAQIKRGSYPWIAALLRPNGQLFCGGTLVLNRKVVTAAHCIKDKGHLRPLWSNQLKIMLGFFNLDIPFETGRINSKVHSIYIHPDWNSLTYSYDADIAVLVLENQVQFSPQIQPICMTSKDLIIAAATEGVVVGNGKSSEYIEYENIPKFLKMPIQTDEICMEKDSFFKTLSSGRTFCAGSANGSGVCTGDSGNGFIVKIGTAYYLRGIVSVSLGDPMLGCNVNSYAVFTDALKFIDWISGI